MVNIVVTHRVSSEARKALQEVFGDGAGLVFLAYLNVEERAKELAMADILFSWDPVRELRPDEFNLIPRARMMQLLSAGADHVPVSVFPADLTVASNAGAFAEPMAEHVVAMILALDKHLLIRHNDLRMGKFEQTRLNRMLRGSTCSIIGFGGIGKATARLLRCFEVKIYAINTSGQTNELVEFIGTLKDLEYALRAADVAVISIPLTDSTRKLIGKRELAWMKDDAILINVSRGEIIDEAALYEHLKSHEDFMAGIDAWWIEPNIYGEFRTNYPFLGLPNVLGSPHNSGFVPGILATATRRAAENIRRFLREEPVTGIVRKPGLR